MKPVKIYCMANQDRSDRVRWLLEELQIPYENVYLKKKNGDLNSEEYLKLNSMGRVPTIVDGETVMFESVGICLYLADKYKQHVSLAPDQNNAERAMYLQWMVWSVASLECVVARMFTHVRTPEEKAVTHAFVKEQCEVLVKPLLQTLKAQEYILKTGFSAADIMLAAVLPGAWDYIVEPYPEVKSYMERLMTRPAAIKTKVFEAPEAH
ncbi:MAG: glutathione S-transferase family protein [Pseudobdellovibrio sp.]